MLSRIAEWQQVSDCVGSVISPTLSWGFLGDVSGKESACQCSRCKTHGFDLWVGKIPRCRKWQPAPLFLPGKLHGERSLAGYSLWDHKESDSTEHAGMHATLSLSDGNACWDYFVTVLPLHIECICVWGWGGQCREEIKLSLFFNLRYLYQEKPHPDFMEMLPHSGSWK